MKEWKLEVSKAVLVLSLTWCCIYPFIALVNGWNGWFNVLTWLSCAILLTADFMWINKMLNGENENNRRS